jgi:hypothetical protein
VSGSFYDERPFLRDYERGTGRFWRSAAIRPKADFSQVRPSIIRRSTGLSLLHLQAALSRLLTHP